MHPFAAHLAARWPPDDWADVTVVLAVSGGADSAALLRAMDELKRIAGRPGRLVVGHFNHGLRGAAAMADEQFVADLCDRLAIDCQIGRLAEGELAANARDGIEQAARHARYRFLRELAGRVGARFLATAHTADDQAETVLHRILRGTGIRGLAGIRRIGRLGHLSLVRPMLAIGRAEVLAYLADLGQDYRVDASNADCTMTRNRIRRKLLPQLARQYNPGVAEALRRLATQAEEVQAFIDGQVGPLLDCHISRIDGQVVVDLDAIADQPPFLVKELLIAVWRHEGWPMQAMGFDEWSLLAQLARAGEPRRVTLPGGVDVQITPGHMTLDASPS